MDAALADILIKDTTGSGLARYDCVWAVLGFASVPGSLTDFRNYLIAYILNARDLLGIKNTVSIKGGDNYRGHNYRNNPAALQKGLIKPQNWDALRLLGCFSWMPWQFTLLK